MQITLKIVDTFYHNFFIEEILKKKRFEFLRSNWINLLFLHMCERSDIDEQGGHKVVTEI